MLPFGGFALADNAPRPDRLLCSAASASRIRPPRRPRRSVHGLSAPYCSAPASKHLAQSVAAPGAQISRTTTPDPARSPFPEAIRARFHWHLTLILPRIRFATPTGIFRRQKLVEFWAALHAQSDSVTLKLKVG